MRTIRYLLAPAAIFMLLAQPERASSQTPVPPSERIPIPLSGESRIASEQPDSSLLETTQVSVPVLVTDEDGNVLSGLGKQNFRLFDNDAGRRIDRVEQNSGPMTMVVLMEYSAGSYGYFANKAAYWGAGFLNHLEANDWIALVTFDLKPTVRADFTRNRIEIRDAVENLGLPTFSEANLFDALMDTLDKLEKVKGRKSILLLATGANTFSAATLDDVLERLKRSDTVVFSVGMAEAESVRYGPSITQTMQKNWLSSLAEQSGGIAFFPRFDTEMADTFRSVAGFLRNEYTLTFSRPKDSRDGIYHKLMVEVIGEDERPLKVRNDHGKLRKVEAYFRPGYTAANR